MFGFPLLIGATEAILTSAENIPCLQLLLIAIVKALDRKSAETVTSFKWIKSKPSDFLTFIHFRSSNLKILVLFISKSSELKSKANLIKWSKKYNVSTITSKLVTAKFLRKKPNKSQAKSQYSWNDIIWSMSNGMKYASRHIIIIDFEYGRL